MKLITLIAILFVGTGASAQNPFDGVTEKLDSCFRREYTPQHLNANPSQKVTAMAVKLSKEVFWGDDEANTKYVIDTIKIQATTRGTDQIYGIELSCAGDGRCSIECDGPQVNIRYSENNPGSLLVDNSAGRLVLDPLTCGDVTEEDVELANLFLDNTKGADDIFRVDPIPAWQCL